MSSRIARPLARHTPTRARPSAAALPGLLGSALTVAALPALAWAQAAPAGDAQSTLAPLAPASRPASERMTTLEQRVEQLQTKIDQLSFSAPSGELAERDEPDPSLAEELQPFERALSIYGFFDVMLHKFVAPDGGFFAGLLGDSLTFLINRINLYVSSRMTETVSALLELRFTFLPLGDVDSFAAPALGVPYGRVDTTVLDPWTAAEYKLNGLMIERVHLSWEPLEYFNILVGRFLTPFGIWNIDHGSPVLIPARQPLLILREPIPLAQTGVQVYGRLHPTDRITLSYAVTLSNGRGPIDAVYDLDDHKALGLRLRASFELADLRVSLGSYGYWGKYTDKQQNVTRVAPFTVAWATTASYTELIGALDLAVHWKGIQLQGELVGGQVTFDVRPPVQRGTGVMADHLKLHVYGLLAYTLPLSRWIGEMRLRPYLMLEWENGNDTDRTTRGVAYTFGLNFQPIPWVTLKTEFFKVITLNDELVEPHFWGVTGQVAVAF